MGVVSESWTLFGGSGRGARSSSCFTGSEDEGSVGRLSEVGMLVFGSVGEVCPSGEDGNVEDGL